MVKETGIFSIESVLTGIVIFGGAAIAVFLLTQKVGAAPSSQICIAYKSNKDMNNVTKQMAVEAVLAYFDGTLDKACAVEFVTAYYNRTGDPSVQIPV